MISFGDEGVPEPGEVVNGKFRIEERLGTGGLGVVVAATHLQLQQRVAIKFLLPCAMASADGVQRFLREAQAAAAIESPHCVRVMDFGTLEIGMPYIVMECLRGTDLRSFGRDHGPMRPELAAECVLQACDAVAEAHSRGIIHRDLKPANLFLCERGDGTTHVKVLDFGIAKIVSSESKKDLVSSLTDEDIVLGTACYMSPEQVRDSKSVDARTDVWALGLILHELVAGSQAFTGRTTRAAAAAIVLDPPPPLRTIVPSAPEALESIILRCLEKDPQQRFVSVRALMTALRPLAEGARGDAAPRVGPTSPSKPTVAAVLVAGTVLTAIAMSLVVQPRSRPERRGSVDVGEISAAPASPPAGAKEAAPPETGDASPIASSTPATSASTKPAAATATTLPKPPSKKPPKKPNLEEDPMLRNRN